MSGIRRFFVFKQKTAYEVRISDWSSDVCSSDLAVRQTGQTVAKCQRAELLVGLTQSVGEFRCEMCVKRRDAERDRQDAEGPDANRHPQCFRAHAGRPPRPAETAQRKLRRPPARLQPAAPPRVG